jgi:ATP-dependent exoDNAse (exonuclease V) alpha subunit
VSKYPTRFTEEQKNALDKLEAFMNNPSQHIFTLYGAAGTGKTYILKYFLDHICKVSVCPTAPTHKAVRVIESMTNRKAKTFHSLHGLRPNVEINNFDIANPQFDPLAEPKIKDYRLIIVDECSQINSSLQRLNEERAKTYNVKILYVGE